MGIVDWEELAIKHSRDNLQAIGQSNAKDLFLCLDVYDYLEKLWNLPHVTLVDPLWLQGSFSFADDRLWQALERMRTSMRSHGSRVLVRAPKSLRSLMSGWGKGDWLTRVPLERLAVGNNRRASQLMELH